MKEIVQRNTTITLDLETVAKDFEYNLEVDAYDDVFHDGYSAEDIRKQDLRLPKKYDGLNRYFPHVVAMALEDAERSAYASAIYNERLNALENCLLKIDLLGGGAEYREMEGSMVSTKAGITDVKINKENGTIDVTICNPEHLINTVLAGVGYFSAELSAFEAETDDKIKSLFHHLKQYFSVYGESKPSGDLSSQYSPDIDQEFFAEEISHKLNEINLDEAAQAVLDFVEETEEEVSCAEFAKFLSFSAEEIKNKAKEINKNNAEFLDSRIK